MRVTQKPTLSGLHAPEGAVVNIGLPFFVIALQKVTPARETRWACLFDTRFKQAERHRSQWISFD